MNVILTISNATGIWICKQATLEIKYCKWADLTFSAFKEDILLIIARTLPLLKPVLVIPPALVTDKCNASAVKLEARVKDADWNATQSYSWHLSVSVCALNICPHR